ncbi:pyridoxal phosphate-dependent transferase [Crassisporium funariophilum]|nr:pyridoxal phosphate-dependent transferase [Crassisporium funariophilum]
MSKLSEKYTQDEAIDLSHHLSRLARNRALSPLKGLQKYFGKPGILSLAGGLPSPAYFPFDSISADALISGSFPVKVASETPKGSLSWIWSLFSNTEESTSPISVPKYPLKAGDLNLATALQYGMSGGLPQLQKVIHEFTGNVYKPAYSNFTTLLHAGNTDGWMKIVTTLCNPGEGVLTSEWTYPSAIATMTPFGITPVPLPMDGQGMRSDTLRDTLSGWDEKARGMPRPHVMYIIPVGQNPTGATMQFKRKQEIYNICVEFDIIIVEDDPYYFLQEGPYVPQPHRLKSVGDIEPSDEQYIASLAPSFLACDVQGRVVRLDTFSKTVAPGCRLGWFTCNPIFAERLERQAETSTQAPCGFGQSLVTALLLQWQYSGYLRWLKGLGSEYRHRRDFFIDCLADKFHLELGESTMGWSKGCERYFASKKGDNFKRGKGAPMFSFIPPTSGMFVWLQLHFDQFPKVDDEDDKSLERKLWIALAEAGVLFGPGNMFSANASVGDPEGSGHFRISFSNAEFDELKKAVDIFANVIATFFENA